MLGALRGRRHETGKDLPAENLLRGLSTNIMLADENFTITYVNPSLAEMLAGIEADLRRALPGFDARALIGKNIDVFHRNPEKQHRILQHLSGQHRAQIEVGGRVLSLNVTPVTDVAGQRRGYCVEWADVTRATAMRRVQDDVRSVLEAASRNDMTRRVAVDGVDAEDLPLCRAANTLVDTLALLESEIRHVSAEHERGDIDVVLDTARFDENFRPLAQSVNDMVAGHIAVKKKAMAVVKAFGEGDFDAPLERFPGKKVFINEIIEQVRANLKKLIADTRTLSKAALEGRLDVRADASAQHGDFRVIVQGFNDTLDAVIGPLTEVSRLLAAVEQGDLTQSITQTYAGQLEELRQAANSTVDRLAETVSEVIGASDQLTSAASQIGSASQMMSQSATEQAASIEQTSASIEEMVASIGRNSANATVTNDIARKAAADAGEGGAAVDRMVEAMSTIASKIAIIDDIAFQTNILALNATIEAARAGEHGKGFAVVAAEVGKLAEHSQVAAQEIGELAKNSVQTAERAGALLATIVPNIGKTSELVQEISDASADQAAGAGQINTAVGHMNQIAQQNASSSEELAATAEQMSAQTSHLQQMMRFFQVKGTRGGASTFTQPIANPAASVPAPRASSTVSVDFDDAGFERF